VPGAELIPDSAELFLGFTSTQKAGLGPPLTANVEELGYADGVGWRSLLESERFRALLEEEPLARAA
jgi:hypothetical protein